jgi:16S rRNA G966 N2-methylase RsmD
MPDTCFICNREGTPTSKCNALCGTPICMRCDDKGKGVCGHKYGIDECIFGVDIYEGALTPPPPTCHLYQDDAMTRLGDLSDADLVLVDPPYAVTKNNWDEMLSWDKLWQLLDKACKPDAVICVFSQQPFTTQLIHSNMNSTTPKKHKYDWYWVKPQGSNFFNSKKEPMRNVEVISVFYKTGTRRYQPQKRQGLKPYKNLKAYRRNQTKLHSLGTSDWCTSSEDGSRYPLQTLEYPTCPRPRRHPCEKPVALLEYIIKTYTSPGDTVLDFCMGSGSTGEAALKSKRNFIGIEKDPAVYTMALSRLDEL